MHESSKYTLDFLDHELRKLSKICFNVDKESRVILGIIAKNGPSSETKITSLGIRRTILSREIIRYRILKSDLSGKDNYLSMKRGRKIGNLQKVEKLYSLTLKGVLSSLSEVPLRENFWMKNYMHMINKISDENTSKEFLNHIYLHIVLFLILHAKKVGILTNYENLETDFYDEYVSGGNISNLVGQTQIKGIPIEFKKIFVDSFIPYFVSFNVVGNLLKNSLRLDYSSTHDEEQEWEYDEFIDKIFRRWMWTMFFSTNKTPKQILKISENYFDPSLMESIINVSEEIGDYELLSGSSIDSMAEDKLEKIDSTIEYDYSKSLDSQS